MYIMYCSNMYITSSYIVYVCQFILLFCGTPTIVCIWKNCVPYIIIVSKVCGRYILYSMCMYTCTALVEPCRTITIITILRRI